MRFRVLAEETEKLIIILLLLRDQVFRMVFTVVGTILLDEDRLNETELS